MVNKSILKQVIYDNRRMIEQYEIQERDWSCDGAMACLVFVGVRRSGKSYMLFAQMQRMLREGSSWEDMLYINFEDERLDGLEAADLNQLLECHIEMGGNERPWLFLDEVQNITGWEKFARRMADAKYHIWITGSNAKMLSGEIMTTLGGRYMAVDIYPYSFTEFLRSSNIDFSPEAQQSTVGKSHIRKAYLEYLTWGGLPETLSLTGPKRHYLSAVYQKIYLGDICLRHRVSTYQLLKLLLKKMAESVKQPISYTRIARILSSMGGKISIPTTSSYISYCEDAWLLLRLRNIGCVLAERETNCKYYFIDNGLLSLILLDATTTLLENIVAIELMRRYGHDPNHETVYFYNQGVEVDFYIPDEELAIQVSYNIDDPETNRREVEALSRLPHHLPCSRRLILTDDEDSIINDEWGQIEVIPVWKWLLKR